MKKIMITGCNGQLGRALNSLYEKEQNIEIINTDVFPGDHITPLDITDVDAVLSFVKERKPDAIINCAAHTNVDKCETDIDNAYKINAVGPRNLSLAATETGAKLMHISTDYVFPGTESRALTEISSGRPPALWNWRKRSDICCPRKITVCFTEPVRGAAAGQILRRRSSGLRRSIRK